MPDHAEEQKQELIDRKIIVRKGDKLVFSQDFLITSTNIAAAIVTGRSVNARTAWKDENGNDLKSYQKEDI